MSMRLINASATWQRYISHLLHELHDREVVVYLDDIVIYIKKDSERHRQLVKEVLQILIDNELYVDLKKTEFYKTEVEFLDHLVELHEIRMNSEKVSAIKN